MPEVTRERLREIATNVRKGYKPAILVGDCTYWPTRQLNSFAVSVAERALAEQRAHDRELVCVMSGKTKDECVGPHAEFEWITRAEHESRRERGR